MTAGLSTPMIGLGRFLAIATETVAMKPTPISTMLIRLVILQFFIFASFMDRAEAVNTLCEGWVQCSTAALHNADFTGGCGAYSGLYVSAMTLCLVN